jgi:hypothetical protein
MRHLETLRESQDFPIEAWESDAELKSLQQRLDASRQLAPPSESHVDRTREMIRLASRMGDAGALPNMLIAMGNSELAMAVKEGSADNEELSKAVPLIRDAVARLRLLAGMEPGSSYESALVRALRFEGETLNDLGQSDEASRAFARADEIIDRYPTADPMFMQ